MFRCPVSGQRLVKARAGGGTIWYSPASDGRMIGVDMARHFFGVNRTAEIWVQSDRSTPNSQNDCPSCRRPMRETRLPTWVSTDSIDVCRLCRIFWIDAGKFKEVPVGSELLHEKGDSTLVRDLGDAYVKYQENKVQIEIKNADGETDPPDSYTLSLAGFMGLPVERSNRHVPEWTIISGLILVVMIYLQWFFNTPEHVREYGFYPADPFKNGGFNIFISVFMHAGWLHLFSNSYFAFILSDDVEDDLGWKKYLALLGFTIVFIAIMQIFFSGGKDIPHLGYSGVVMSLFAYYAFQFPKSKMVWMLPRIKQYSEGKFRTWMTGWGWYQFRVLWVAALYFVLDVTNFFMFERGGGSGTSYSAHVGGFIAGYVFWKLFAVKTFNSSERDVFENYMDRLVDPPAAKSPHPAIKNTNQLKSKKEI